MAGVSIQLTEEVQALINTISERENLQNTIVDVSEASSKGENYLGKIYRINVKDKTQKKTKSFIVKVAPTVKIFRESMPLRAFYEREINAYERVLPTLYNVQEKYNIPKEERFSYAKYYGSISEEEKETIILEDLGFKGFKMYNRKTSFNKQHLEIVIKTLARFHAISFVLKLTDPKIFKDLSKLILKEIGYGSGAEKYLIMAKNNCVKILKDQRIQNRVNDSVGNPYEKMQSLISANRTEPYNVICHGDCWINNFLFKYENEQVKQVIFVDLQIMRLASPVTDLAYMIFSSTDEEVRSTYYESMLNLYYETLDSSITRMGCRISECYPIEIYRDQIKSTMPLGLVSAIMLLPLILSDKENVPDLETPPSEINDDAYEKLMCENCKNRLNGVAKDCLKYGYI